MISQTINFIKSINFHRTHQTKRENINDKGERHCVKPSCGVWPESKFIEPTYLRVFDLEKELSDDD